MIARAKSGCASAQTKPCMQPIDVPISSRSRVDPEPLDQHPPLRLDHVVIIIFREMHPHPVARLGRFAVADIVGEDDVIAG